MACNNNNHHVFEKPLPHLALDDWHSRSNQLRNAADLHRNDAFELRQSSRNLRNETAVQTTWDTYQNNARLADRVAELDSWRQTMQSCFERLVSEMNFLRLEKNRTESDLEALRLPFTVVTECLSMRDARVQNELTQDDADVELKKELHVVESNQKMLRDQCQNAWDKLNQLTEVRTKIDVEIEDKTGAQDCDMNQLSLDRFSSHITYKLDPLRNPKNACTYQGWLQHSRHMKAYAESELEDSAKMRESLYVSREKARNALKTQQETTEHTIRKRIFETQRARNELEWQMLKIKEEMEKVKREIEALEQALVNKTNSLKLAETRLENRCQRPGMELCLDEVYSGLCEEVKQLRKTRLQLSDQLDSSKVTYNTLEGHANRMDADLQRKQHSLMIDIRTLDLRQRLREGEFAEPRTETDRNIQLMGLQREIPPI